MHTEPCSLCCPVFSIRPLLVASPPEAPRYIPAVQSWLPCLLLTGFFQITSASSQTLRGHVLCRTTLKDSSAHCSPEWWLPSWCGQSFLAGREIRLVTNERGNEALKTSCKWWSNVMSNGRCVSLLIFEQPSQSLNLPKLKWSLCLSTFVLFLPWLIFLGFSLDSRVSVLSVSQPSFCCGHC